MFAGPPTSPPLSDDQSAKRIKLSETEGPPVPPRSRSISPPQAQQTKVNIYNTTDPFLGVGRGGDLPPLGQNAEQPPPLPAKTRRSPPVPVGEIEDEEKALLSELDELAKMVAPPNGDIPE